MENHSSSVLFQAASPLLSSNPLIQPKSSSKTKDNMQVKHKSTLILSTLPKKSSKKMESQVFFIVKFIGLYKGVDSAIMRQFIYCGMRLGIYKALEDRVRLQENRNLSFGEKIQYSLFSGAIGSAIANPTDVALIRFQSDNSLPAAERRNYKNVVDALVKIAGEDGVRGLWTGAIPTVSRAMAVNSSQLVSYNEAKEELLKYTGEKK